MSLGKEPQRTLPIGLIGIGSMGSFVARTILKGEVPGARLVAVADISSPVGRGRRF